MPLNPAIPLQVQGIDPRTSLAVFQTIRNARQDDEDRRQQDIDRTLRRNDDAEMRTERQRTRARETGVEDALRGATDDTGKVDWAKAAANVRNVSPVQAAAWWKQADQERLLDAKKRIDEQARTAGGLLNTDDATIGPAYTRERARLIESGMATADQIPDGTTFQSPAQLRAFLQDRLAAAMEPKELYDTLEKKITEAQKAADKPKNLQRFTATDGKAKFEVSWDKDADKYFRGGTDITADVAAGRITEYAKPTGTGNSGGGVMRVVSERQTDGSIKKVLRRVNEGDVLDEGDSGPTPTDKRKADAWKQAELSGLERKFREQEISRDELERGKLDVENGYRAKIGEDPISGLDEQWAWRPATGGGQRPAAAPFGPSDANAATPRATTQPPANAPVTPTRNNPKPAENTKRGNDFSVTVAGKVYSFKDAATLDEFKRRAGLSTGAAPMPRTMR